MKTKDGGATPESNNRFQVTWHRQHQKVTTDFKLLGTENTWVWAVDNKQLPELTMHGCVNLGLQKWSALTVSGTGHTLVPPGHAGHKPNSPWTQATYYPRLQQL